LFQHIRELKAQPQGYRTVPIIKNSDENNKNKGIDGCTRIFLLPRDIVNDVDSKEEFSSSLSLFCSARSEKIRKLFQKKKKKEKKKR